MSKEELEKAIENGESVWVVEDRGKTIYEIKLNKYSAYVRDNSFYANTMLPYQLDPHYICSIDKVKTKSEAEHYLHHANITRTEILPFLSWEEFKDMKMLEFTKPNNELMILRYDYWLHSIILEDGHFNKICWDDNEENFYKAYDECVKLFKGEE
ncbi:MAG: hypothetical protein ACI4PF_03545 [Christensenellales bacterium]